MISIRTTTSTSNRKKEKERKKNWKILFGIFLSCWWTYVDTWPRAKRKKILYVSGWILNEKNVPRFDGKFLKRFSTFDLVFLLLINRKRKNQRTWFSTINKVKIKDKQPKRFRILLFFSQTKLITSFFVAHLWTAFAIRWTPCSWTITTETNANKRTDFWITLKMCPNRSGHWCGVTLLMTGMTTMMFVEFLLK